MDQITIEAARRNDRSAREKLLRQLQDPWYRMCLSMLRNDDLARDATQETGLRFLSLLHKFRGDSSILTWSTGIAINVVREMRRKNRATSELDDQPLAAVQSTAPDQLERDDLQGILAQLPDRQREAITLRYFQDLSVEETATAMDCASGTVKATIHQALRKLKKRMIRET